MKKLFAKVSDYQKTLGSKIGIGVVLAVFVVLVQLVGVSKLFYTPTNTVNPSNESTDKATSFGVNKDAGSSALIVAGSTDTENKCKQNIKEVNDAGKLKRLVIPSLSLGLPIIRVPIENGTWEVFEGVANFAEATSEFNGLAGNSVLYGHNKPDAFRPISGLKAKDLVNVQTTKYQFTYEVYELVSVVPNNMDIVQPGSEKQLTLLTCNGKFDEKRLAVKSRLVEITQLNCK
ncbi:MAG: sortase [bacterium]|nr:sortase [bacterium]